MVTGRGGSARDRKLIIYNRGKGGTTRGEKLIIYNRRIGGAGKGGLARDEKLIIYNRGTGGINGLKNPSEKCEGQRKVDRIKNQNGQWEGPGGGTQWVHYAPGSH